MNDKPDLSLEERLAYAFAQQWRDENYRPNLQGVDWLRFAKILVHNRMTVLAQQVFLRFNPSIPQEAQNLMREQTERYERSAYKLGDALRTGALRPKARGGAHRGAQVLRGDSGRRGRRA